MDKPVIVLGAGGHAKVVIDALIKQGTKIVGVVDSDLSKINTKILGIPIIGNDDVVMQYSNNDIYLVNGIGSIGSTKIRKNIFIKFRDQGYKFAVVVHPSAIIAADVQLQQGSQVMAGAIIQTGTIIAQNSVVNTKVSIDHECIIQSHTHVSPGVTICGGVSVGEGTHIGTGTTIIQNVKIGANVIIGAGSLVLKDVAENKLIYGNPAKEVNV